MIYEPIQTTITTRFFHSHVHFSRVKMEKETKKRLNDHGIESLIEK